MFSRFKQDLLTRARAAGFLDVRIASARPDATAAANYRDWIAAGHHGEMGYLENLLDERTTGLDHVLPGAQSIIIFVAPYYKADDPPVFAGRTAADSDDPPAIGSASSSSADRPVRIARYALGADYHYVLKDRLRPIANWIAHAHPGHTTRIATDSAPIMERTYAAAAGLGFIGKNGMLISWMQGSYTLLASIITTVALPPDPPRVGTCGQCTRCIDACPTQAIIRPGQLDARRCISYLTIEKKSELSAEESAATGEWAFGCDICQDVCPYNKSPHETTITEFAPGTNLHTYERPETFLTPQSNSQFEKRFPNSPLLRPGKRRIQKLVNEKINP